MLKLKDAMALSKAIDKMQVADQITEIYKNREDKEQVGIKLMALVGSKLHRAKDEVISIVSSSTGKKIEEVEEMPINEIVATIKGFFSQEGVKDFLSKYVED